MRNTVNTIPNSGFFFRVGSRQSVVGSRYRPSFCERVYILAQNLKIRFIVPINMIFSKTVSSLFLINILNNLLRIRQTERREKSPQYRLFGKRVSIPTTDYRLLNTDFENLRGESCRLRQVLI